MKYEPIAAIFSLLLIEVYRIVVSSSYRNIQALGIKLVNIIQTDG